MTKAEQSLADDKVRAEIANLNNLSAKLAAETARINSELPAFTAKLAAETSHIQVETNYYVLFRGIALGAGLLGAGAAASKLLFGL